MAAHAMSASRATAWTSRRASRGASRVLPGSSSSRDRSDATASSRGRGVEIANEKSGSGSARVVVVVASSSSASESKTAKTASYYKWSAKNGIEATKIRIGYLGAKDDNETSRSCVATAPIAAGDVLARCPAELVLALPPNAPNPFPDYIPTPLWDKAPGVTAGSCVEDFRMALVLLRERSLGDDSAWAPYIAQLPAGYDLLGCWTDDQLEELQCERLQDAARAQRAENNAAFDAVRMNVSAYDSDYDLGLGALTKEDVVWGLNTVRSRSYRATYPSSCGVLPPLSNLEGKTLDAAALLTKSARRRSGEKSESANKESVFMLPFLDALNHRDNKGSGGATKLVFMSPLEDDAAERGAKGTFELRSPAAVEKDAEAVVCYGDKNNEELLLRYGFCVENGVHDEITLPGCMDELEWVMPGSARESDLKAERLDEAVKRARLNDEGKASVNLLWALRVLLASDATYEAAGGAKGLMRASLPGEDGGEAADAAEDGERPGEVDATEAQLAAEASLALACEQELAKMGGRDALAEDEINYEAASKVSAQIEIECAEDAEACGTPEEAEYLRRLLIALRFRVTRKRVLAMALDRYTPK